MKKPILTLILFLSTCFYCYSQCKADIDKIDKIDKTDIKVWELKLGELSFGASFLNGLIGKEKKDWTAYIRFMRVRNQNYVTFMVTQTFGENESANISRYFGGRNFELALAFDGDLPPVKFQSQIPEHTQAKMLGFINHQVHLSQILNEAKFEELKGAFDKGEISAFRIVLGGGEQIEKSVRDRRAETIKEKFYCFYDYAKQNPVKNVESIDIAKGFKKDPITNKYVFSDVVSLDRNQKDLYKKGVSWLVKNSPSKRTNYENEEEGKIISSCVHYVTYNNNNNVSEDKYSYTATISIKDGRYKYELTDFVLDDGKSVGSLESLLEKVKSRPDILETAFKELKTNIDKIISSLKSEMEGKSDEW